MSEDDKKAWSEAILENDRPHLNQCLQDLMDLGVDTNKFKSVNDRIHEIIENVFRVGHFRGFQAGRDSKGDGWVPIADIPEEWKDGRPVWLYFVNTSVTGQLVLGDRFWGEFERIKRKFPEYCCWQKAHWSPHNGGGWVWNNMSGTPYFAMLPPQPPQDRKEG